MDAGYSGIYTKAKSKADENEQKEKENEKEEEEREIDVYIKSAFKSAFEEALNGGKFAKVFREELGASLRGMLEGMIEKTAYEGAGDLASGVLKGFVGENKAAGIGAAIASNSPTKLIEAVLGSGLSFFGGGIGGLLGGAGVLMSIPEIFSKGHQRPELSGVDEIFGGVNYRSSDFDTLFGSDEFERAVFSARNAGGGVYRKFTEPRRAGVLYGADDEDRWVASSKLNEMAGIPRRTNFNHG